MGGELVSRETKFFFAVLLFLSLAGGVLAWGAAGVFAAGCVLITGLMSVAAFAVYSRSRAREVHALCEYLADVYTGTRTLDIRTQREGELSALRSELYKITVILTEQKAQLASDKNQMADFLGDIAHQLRTPLSAILLQTELWQDPAVSPGEKSECVLRMKQETERMGWLVEELLKLCRLDAKVICFEKKRHSARKLFREAARNAAPLCAKHGITLKCEVDDTISCFCDAEWTVQALSNLIKNAVEHTPENGVVCLLCQTNALYTQFCVQNSGQPIPQEEMPHLFERFWRGKNAAPGSIGIGLALAKAIADGQGGRLQAENGPDGPRFLLRLYAEEK